MFENFLHNALDFVQNVWIFLLAQDWAEIGRGAVRPAVSGLTGLIAGVIGSRWVAMRERSKRGGGFWYDRVTIARYLQLPDGSWFKDSMGGLNLESLFKSQINAQQIIKKTGPLGMNRKSPLYQHVRDILFQESSDRLGRGGYEGIHTLTFRKNDRGDGSRGNLEVVLLPLGLWKSLRDDEELPRVVVGKNHLEAMKACAMAGPPDWFIASQPKSSGEFFEGLAVMKASDAPT